MKSSSKPTPKQDDPEQSKRFIDAARDVGADETEKGADKAFKNIVKGGSLKAKQKRKAPA